MSRTALMWSLDGYRKQHFYFLTPLCMQTAIIIQPCTSFFLFFFFLEETRKYSLYEGKNEIILFSEKHLKAVYIRTRRSQYDTLIFSADVTGSPLSLSAWTWSEQTNVHSTQFVLFHKQSELLLLDAVSVYVRALQLSTQILYTLEMAS